MTLYNILVLHFCCCSPKVKKKNTHQQAKTASLEEKVQVNEGGKSGVSCCNDKTKPDTKIIVLLVMIRVCLFLVVRHPTPGECKANV